MGYRIFRNISQNTAALWITVFCETFRKIQLTIYTHNQEINRSYSHFKFNRFYSRVIEAI